MTEDFRKLRAENFSNVIGAIDLYINIIKPYHDSQSYFNRKQRYAVKLQAIVDSKKRFINIFVGKPGACHDASVWRDSGIYRQIIGNEISIPDKYHLIGDSAYPLDLMLMKPFRSNGHLSNIEKKFNVTLSSSRVVVENVFGYLKGKFRRMFFFAHVQNDSFEICYNCSMCLA